MNTIEFSNEFDTLLNSYNVLDRRYDFVFDEYEKSVFLTRAEEAVVLEAYSGKNPFRDSLEKTEEIREYLRDLVTTFSTSVKEINLIGLSSKSIFFKIPEDLWFITYESAKIQDEAAECFNGQNIEIIPTTQDTYTRISKNPFRKPSNKRALRLDYSKEIVEIISDYTISEYIVRYLRKPKPIILTDLPENLSINGYSTITECELSTAIHPTIISRAVRLAVESRSKIIKET